MTILQATPSASEIVPRFAEEPVSVFEYFQANVRRLVQDNLDSVTSFMATNENVELLSLVDANPKHGEQIQYHEVYEEFTSRDTHSRNPNTTFAIRLTKVPWEAPKGQPLDMRRVRGNSRRSYTASEQDGIIVVEHQDIFGYPWVRNIIGGNIEDPRALGDPLDSPAIALLKRDIERLKMSVPVRTLSQPHHK